MIQAQEEELYMAKITVQIPEPKPEYDESNQRQILEAIDTMKNQLNTSFTDDLKQEQERFNFYLNG